MYKTPYTFANKGKHIEEGVRVGIYRRLHEELHYWRSTNQLEVDFIVNDSVAIEVKAAKKITRRDIKNLEYLAEEKIFKEFCLVSHDPIEVKYENIHCLHWKTFMDRI